MNCALVVIDIQNDYFAGGALPLDGATAASRNAQKALTRFRERQWPVVHIRHVSNRKNAPVFVPESHGAEIHPNVAPVPGEMVIDKHFPNCFRQSPLQAWLVDHQIRTLVVCGMMTHMCVDTTVRAASDLGYEVIVLQDAVATKAITYGDVEVPAVQVQAAFLASLAGAFATVIPVAEYIEKQC